MNLYREADRKKKKDRNTLIGTPSLIKILVETQLTDSISAQWEIDHVGKLDFVAC